MANILEADIIRILTQTRDEIRANMEAQHINASGRTSASIRVEAYEGGARLVGGLDARHDIDDSPGIYGSDTAPIPTLETGRKGGGVPRGFYYIIREWSREKGLQFANEGDRNTFAYFVARKIAREGTRRATEQADVYTTPTRNAIDKINEIIGQSVSRTVRAAIGGANITSIV